MSAPLPGFTQFYAFTGLPENHLGSRDRPKFHDDQTPSCGLADMLSRYAALSAAPRPRVGLAIMPVHVIRGA